MNLRLGGRLAETLPNARFVELGAGGAARPEGGVPALSYRLRQWHQRSCPGPGSMCRTSKPFSAARRRRWRGV